MLERTHQESETRHTRTMPCCTREEPQPHGSDNALHKACAVNVVSGIPKTTSVRSHTPLTHPTQGYRASRCGVTYMSRRIAERGVNGVGMDSSFS